MMDVATTRTLNKIVFGIYSASNRNEYQKQKNNVSGDLIADSE
jgi:hypothetical protein